MFGIGDTEFLLILIFAFLLFGPDKLPALGKTLGKGIRQFREASNSVTKVVQNEVLAPVQESINAEKPLGKEDSSGATSGTAAPPTASAAPPTASAAPATTAPAAPASAKEGVASAAAGAPAAPAPATSSAATLPATSAAPTTPAAPAPSAGQAETFAQKKARLEREYQEKQKAANTSKTDESKGAEAHG